MSDASRQSALLVHGLAQADRDWLLTQLPENDRARLAGHLAELAELGVPADPGLLDTVLAQVGPRPAARGKTDPRQTLRRAGAEVMLQLLGQEPAWMIGTVLSIESWPWREALVEGLDASRRERVRQALRPNVAGALAASCVEKLAAGVPAARQAVRESRAASGRGTHWGHKFKEVVRQWL
ncbi:MAG: hypothetical protein JO218_02330 [Burkholderiales bacterium]|nr:hypothetical protein [Burkholderiales bacterium]